MKFNLFRAPDGTHGGTGAEAPVITRPAVLHSADPDAPVKIAARDVSVFYGDKQALFDVSMDIADKTVTALIGPSGCGKSTFLRTMNRMNDTIPGAKVVGPNCFETPLSWTTLTRGSPGPGGRRASRPR